MYILRKMSSAVQANLNSKTTSAINPDYYVDQNRCKLNLCEVDYVILNGGTLVLSRDLIHNKKIFVTVTAATTVRLPAPELCLGVEFEVNFDLVAVGATTFTSTANASVLGSSVINILGTVFSSNSVISSYHVPKTSLSIAAAFSSCTVLCFRSMGLYWFIEGSSEATASFS